MRIKPSGENINVHKNLKPYGLYTQEPDHLSFLIQSSKVEKNVLEECIPRKETYEWLSGYKTKG